MLCSRIDLDLSFSFRCFSFQAHVGFRDAFLVNGCLFFLGIICLICTRPYRLPPRRRCLFYLQKNCAGPLVLAELVVIGNQTKEPVLVATLHDFSYGNHFIHDVSLASLAFSLITRVLCTVLVLSMSLLSTSMAFLCPPHIITIKCLQLFIYMSLPITSTIYILKR